MQPTLFEIRDNRQKEWFWIDNDLIDTYGKVIGGNAVLVYVALSRHADQGTQACFPSMSTIAAEMGFKSRNTVAKQIKILRDYNMIGVEETKDRDGRRRNNTYVLLNKKNWKPIGMRMPEFKVTAELQEAEPNPVMEKIVNERMQKASRESSQAMFPWLNLDMWEEWVEYRKGIKKKLTPLTIKQQMKFLEQHKEDHAEIIRTSIMNGWTGLFPLKVKREVKKVEAPKGKYAHLS